MQRAIELYMCGAYNTEARYNSDPEHLAAVASKQKRRERLYRSVVNDTLPNDTIDRIHMDEATAIITGMQDVCDAYDARNARRVLKSSIREALKSQQATEASVAALQSNVETHANRIDAVDFFVHGLPAKMRDLIELKSDTEIENSCAELEHQMEQVGIRAENDATSAARNETLSERTAAQALKLDQHERLITELRQLNTQLAHRESRHYDDLTAQLEHHSGNLQRLEATVAELNNRVNRSEALNTQLKEQNARLESTIDGFRSGILDAFDRE